MGFRRCWSGRLVLALLAAGAGAVLSAVRAAAAAPRTTQLLVYATREGLVGGITANGHVIVPHDHFASLPSWGSLSPNGTGTYSVRVCGVGRCVYEPVWDVGPWNTHDDYWSPLREQWRDLPLGGPQGQAPYPSGDPRGRGQYGGDRPNPARGDPARPAGWDRGP